jgi:ankyrin repeat protein
MVEPALTEAVQTDLPSSKPNRRKRLALRFAVLVAAVSAPGINHNKSALAQSDAAQNVWKTAPILEAAYKGELETVQKLLASGADPNARDEYKRTPLMLCMNDPDKPRLVKLLLASGADINAKDDTGCNAVFHAIDRPAMLKILLTKRPDLASRNDDGRTPLEEAGHYGHMRSAELLTRAGAPGNLEAEKSWKTLFSAITKRDAAQVRRLLHSAPGLERVVTSQRRSMLHIAAERGDVLSAKELLNSGADPNAKDTSDWTPLLEAAADGHTDIVRVMVEHGGNVNSHDIHGRTALMEASYYRHRDTVEFLLSQGAKVNAIDEHGHSALSDARRPDIELLLVKAGAKK